MDASMIQPPTEPAAEAPAEQPSSPPAEADKPAKPAKKEDNFFVFLLKLLVIVAVFRSFFFSPFNIPSESMLPRLVNGDYLLAAKWPYGFSKYSLPFNVPLIPGRILPGEPERGDVVIFKHPVDQVDYIKRVIGLPGDTVQMVDGTLHLNGLPVPKERIDNFEVQVSPNTRCRTPLYMSERADGAMVCSYPRYRETLPGGRSYEVLDLGRTPQDNTPPIVVPADSLRWPGRGSASCHRKTSSGAPRS
jgi:signal peptidase I